jgi:phage terminase small subunit
MAVLQNAKHERFAQEVAKGASNRDAYEAAGYSVKNEAATDASASRLLSDARVQARVTEIQERAAVRTEITVASITDRLLKIAARGETKDEAPMLSVARAALMDAAKLNGLVVDLSKVDAEVKVRSLADFYADPKGD